MAKVEFLESETMKNLARAFAGESQAGLRYQMLAQKCMQEGYEFLQSEMKKIAKNEVAHAKAYYNMICDLGGGSLENINIEAGFPFRNSDDLTELFRLNMINEQMEAESIYPSFAAVARDEGFKDAEKLFKLVEGVENCHYLLLKQLHEKLKTGKIYKSTSAIKWKCDLCGHEETGKEPSKQCPLCTMQQGYYQVPLDLGKDQ